MYSVHFKAGSSSSFFWRARRYAVEEKGPVPLFPSKAVEHPFYEKKRRYALKSMRSRNRDRCFHRSNPRRCFADYQSR